MNFLKLRRRVKGWYGSNSHYKLFHLSFDPDKEYSAYGWDGTLIRKTLCQKGVHSRARLPFNNKIQRSQRRFRDYLLDNITPLGRRGRPLKKG